MQHTYIRRYYGRVLYKVGLDGVYGRVVHRVGCSIEQMQDDIQGMMVWYVGIQGTQPWWYTLIDGDMVVYMCSIGQMQGDIQGMIVWQGGIQGIPPWWYTLIDGMVWWHMCSIGQKLGGIQGMMVWQGGIEGRVQGMQDDIQGKVFYTVDLGSYIGYDSMVGWYTGYTTMVVYPDRWYGMVVYMCSIGQKWGGIQGMMVWQGGIQGKPPWWYTLIDGGMVVYMCSIGQMWGGIQGIWYGRVVYKAVCSIGQMQDDIQDMMVWQGGIQGIPPWWYTLIDGMVWWYICVLQGRSGVVYRVWWYGRVVNRVGCSIEQIQGDIQGMMVWQGGITLSVLQGRFRVIYRV